MSQSISQLDELAYPLQGSDWIPISRGAQTFKASPSKLFQGLLKFVPGFEGYVVVPGDGNINDEIVEIDDILIGKGAFFNGKHVTMRALQDNPTEDSHFETGLEVQE